MAKETSDSINAGTAMASAEISLSGNRQSVADYVALALATFGVGFIPIAPGTWGSAVGVALFWAVAALGSWVFSAGTLYGIGFVSEVAVRNLVLLVAIAIVTFSGIWAASRVERSTGRKDPGIVVVDEVAGQLIVYLLLPISFGPWTLVAGFIAFRVFDIWKPYPIRNLEKLESGLGIMADDILAGVYAAVLLLFLTTFRIIV